MRGVWFTVACLLALLMLAAGGSWWMWGRLEGELGLHGTLALLLGAALTIAVWVGLMSLIYYSHRRGYDDEAGH